MQHGRIGVGTSLLAAAALALAAGVAGAAPRVGQGEEGKAASVADDEIERLESWPEVEDRETARGDVERVRKARTPEMASGGRDGLVAAGAGVVPMILPTLGREKDEEAAARLEEVLDAVTDARHTRLLAREFADRSPRVRAWCLRRAARFPDSGLRAAAEAALEAARERAEKAKDEASEAELELYAAGLCCASAGSLAGLDPVARRAAEEWGRVGPEVRAALAAVRGPEATRAVAPLLREEARERKLAGLHLLAACGDAEEAPGLVRPFLDTNDNSLRIAAINALRGIVDGDPPLERLAVFDAIEEANRWKERL